MTEIDLQQPLTPAPMDGSHADIQNQGGVAEIERLRRALDEEQHRNLRLRADLANVRRREAGEQAIATVRGRRAVLLPLLDVLDTLDRALAVGSIDPHFYDGVVAISRLLTKAVLEAGAEPFDGVGQSFDPARHEALEGVPADGSSPGTIVRQVRRGWQLGDELLRPAQVVVAIAPESGSDVAR
jgi:molecular chaperone GrpE